MMTLSRTHKLLLMVIVIFGTLCVFCLVIGTGIQWVSGWSLNRQVEKNNKAANTAVKEASNANANAANYSIERRVEDEVREKVIKPRQEAARSNSDLSRAEVREAKTKYEKRNTENLNSDSVVNCRELRELFPDTTFEDCQ